jgi:hypothetical protein
MVPFGSSFGFPAVIPFICAVVNFTGAAFATTTVAANANAIPKAFIFVSFLTM